MHPITKIQYAFFNERVYPQLSVPEAERWLFDEPFRVFPIGTLRQEVDRLLASYHREGVRYLGKNQTPTRVVLMASKVTFEPYQKVVLSSLNSLNTAGKK